MRVVLPSLNLRFVPSYHRSPDTGDVGAVPEGMFIVAAPVTLAAKVALPLNREVPSVRMLPAFHKPHLLVMVWLVPVIGLVVQIVAASVVVTLVCVAASVAAWNELNTALVAVPLLAVFPSVYVPVTTST